VRLTPGATWAGAQADADVIAARIRDVDQRHPTFGMTVTPLLDQVVGNVRQAVLVLFGSVMLVLLVACANVANLLLARAATREKELAVRTALGAGRRRLMGQMLTESVTLSGLGGVLGLGAAALTLAVVRAIDPGNIPRLDEIGLDGRVLVFTLAVSVATGILFGLAPALRARTLDLNGALKSGGRTGQTSHGLASRHSRRGLLVVAEVALSLTLLIGAGLLIRSFTQLLNVAPGFDPEHVLSLQVMLSGSGRRQPEQVAQFYERVADTLRSLPGVRAAGATQVLPLTPTVSWGEMTVEGFTAPPGQSDLQVDQRIATPEYFSTMRVPLKEGRFFSPDDGPKSLPVVMIDEKMARHFWPRGSAIGKRVKGGGRDSEGPWRTIVGVVGSVKQYGLEIDGRMVVYFPHKQQQAPNMFVVARTDSEAAAASRSIVNAIRSLDSQATVFDVASMDERVLRSVARQRFAMTMLTAFAVFAALLAAVGVYSVMSYLVSQGTRDIGIRMALGAERSAILTMIFRHGLVLTAGGVVIGLAASLALTRFMSTLLFGVSASDLVTFLSVPALLACLALAASYIPARRATLIDPMVALRDE
jgi:predicted permease